MDINPSKPEREVDYSKKIKRIKAKNATVVLPSNVK